MGLVQSVGAAPSRLQRYVTFASSDARSKVAVAVVLTAAGLLDSVVSGACVSTMNVEFVAALWFP
jgi:hypothetical protein